MPEYKIDLSDIGGPKQVKENASIILKQVEKGKWKEVNLRTVEPSDFINAVISLTHNIVDTKGNPFTVISIKDVETHIQRERVLESIIDKMNIKLKIPEQDIFKK